MYILQEGPKLKQLLVYLKYLKKPVIAAMIFAVLSQVSNLVLPMLMSSIINNGIANSTTVYPYAYVYIYSGGTANNTTMSGGFMYISSGGSADNTTVNSGGSMTIYSGGTATNVIWTPCIGDVHIAI